MPLDLTEVRASFISTSLDFFDQAEALLLRLEKSFDKEALVELLRIVHTVKGNAGIFGLDAAIHLCHALEAFLQQSEMIASPLAMAQVDLGLKAIDCLRNQVRMLAEGTVEQSAFSECGVLIKELAKEVHTPPPRRMPYSVWYIAAKYISA